MFRRLDRVSPSKYKYKLPQNVLSCNGSPFSKNVCKDNKIYLPYLFNKMPQGGAFYERRGGVGGVV